jgi:hypothetical protein
MIPRIAPREDLNPFRIAQIQFDMAAEFLKLDPGLRQVLRTPKRVLEVSLPTKMDNGQVKVLTGYRVQHNVSRGPGKGGIRYHPGVTQFVFCDSSVRPIKVSIDLNNYRALAVRHDGTTVTED